LVPRATDAAPNSSVRPSQTPPSQARSSPPSLDDAAILAAVRAGDRMAATALHHRVRPQVERTIIRLLGRRDRDHEDLTQSSLIEVVRSLERFRGECSLDTWTSRVTAHTVFKELRRRRVELGVFDRSAETDNATGVDLERQLGDRAMVVRLRRHLDAMDSDKAFTLMLHDVCGHDLREIAEITEVSVAAAQSRLVRGRRELHERLARDPELADLLQHRQDPSGGRGQP
jgi:RNA polymerase sigma-70 factor (ECF subfamily)